jgi:hypothetical protein
MAAPVGQKSARSAADAQPRFVRLLVASLANLTAHDHGSEGNQDAAELVLIAVIGRERIDSRPSR